MKQTRKKQPSTAAPPIVAPTIAPTGSGDSGGGVGGGGDGDGDGDGAVDCSGVVECDGGGDGSGDTSVPFDIRICGTRDFSAGLAQPWYGSID